LLEKLYYPHSSIADTHLSAPGGDWNWTFHYALSRRILPANLFSSHDIVFTTDSENNVTGFDIKVSTSDDMAPEEYCDTIARKIVRILSVLSVTRIATHLTGYEGMPAAHGRLGRVSKRTTFIYNIQGAPIKTDRLDLTNSNIRSLMTSVDKSNNLEHLNNAISYLGDGRPEDSITSAFKIIDGKVKSVRGYRKYACIRNILTHDRLYDRVKKDFTKYFPHKHKAFDFKDYVPRKNIIVLDLQSPKTNQTLKKLARDLIGKVKRFLKI
jgi:hypothetical protein